MAGGIRTSANLAVRLAEEFLANLNEDRAQHRANA